MEIFTGTGKLFCGRTGTASKVNGLIGSLRKILDGYYGEYSSDENAIYINRDW